MWEVSVTQLTLITFLASELLMAHTAASVHVTLLCHRPQCITAARLTAAADVVTPVVGCTFVTSLSHGVGRTDTLTCVSVTVISHMGALARCAAAFLEAEVSWSAAVTLLSRHTRLTATLTALVTIKRLRSE